MIISEINDRFCECRCFRILWSKHLAFLLLIPPHYNLPLPVSYSTSTVLSLCPTISSHHFFFTYVRYVLIYLKHVILFLIWKDNFFVFSWYCFESMHFNTLFSPCGPLLWFSLNLILKSIVSHCRSSIQCSTPTAEEEAQEGASPSKPSQTPLLFSSPPSLSGPYLSLLPPLGLLRPTTPRDARARPFWRHTPDTSSLPTLAMGVACILLLGWRALRPLLSLWSIPVLQQLLKDLVLESRCISKDNLTRACTSTKT